MSILMWFCFCFTWGEPSEDLMLISVKKNTYYSPYFTVIKCEICLVNHCLELEFEIAMLHISNTVTLAGGIKQHATGFACLPLATLLAL